MGYVQVFADSAHRGGTRPLPPRLIVIHATGGTDSLAWLTTTPGSAVSAHFLIKRATTVYRLVEDAGIAWHAGVSSWGRFGNAGQPSINEVSIGIELENTNTGGQAYTTFQYKECARVIHRLYENYGHIPIVSHATIAPGRKNDPVAFNWLALNTYLKTLMQGGTI